MAIPTESYGSLHEKYAAALRWMSGLGVRLGPNRTAHYEKVLRHWNEAYESASDDEAREAFPDFVSSVFEIRDFIDISEAFRDVPKKELVGIATKIQKGVNGPIAAIDETPNSTEARNILFEALVAARAHRPQKGVTAILDAASDTGIRMEGKKLWVECKRIKNIDKISDNIRKASKQLERVVGQQVGAGHRGIVALDVTKILNSGDQIYVGQNDAHLLASIDGLMENFIQQYSQIWQRIYERRHRKVIGTIIRFAFMSTSEERKLLVHASQWAMNPRLGAAESDVQLQRHLAEGLSSEF